MMMPMMMMTVSTNSYSFDRSYDDADASSAENMIQTYPRFKAIAYSFRTDPEENFGQTHLFMSSKPAKHPALRGGMIIGRWPPGQIN